ncbi:MAG: nuclear transport factor 2 family protein [Candidatus Dormibacteraeota bacterium]|nr:nuclear transport factor 2 family protein [Candidatus Dormibacteraeota bacterium]
MTEDARVLAGIYFSAWKAKDFDRLRSILADDLSFVGPLAQLTGAEACRQGIESLSRIVTDIVVHKTFVDGPDVLTWFDLHTTVAPPCATANWSHVENGKITAVRVTFDARALTAEPTK